MTGVQLRAFQYDGIGNRQKSANSLTLPAADNYSTNSLNQYTGITGLPTRTHDEDGNLTSGALPADQSGNSTLIWDAENRLVAVTKPDNTITRFSYDYQSRRISKVVDGSPASYYIYDGWNMIATYQIQNSEFTILNSYTWGTDLSGSMQGAGGVGGLLQVTDHGSQSTDHSYPTYDGNGNVSEYIDNTGTTVAHYEYDAFGNTTVSTGTKVNDFEHKFSTKPQDTETGLYYYGYRYYDATVGRWLSRDPIEEDGGLNLYGFVRNNGIDNWDYLGMELCSLFEYWKTRSVSQAWLSYSDFDNISEPGDIALTILTAILEEYVTAHSIELSTVRFTLRAKVETSCQTCLCTEDATTGTFGNNFTAGVYEWVETKKIGPEEIFNPRHIGRGFLSIEGMIPFAQRAAARQKAQCP